MNGVHSTPESDNRLPYMVMPCKYYNIEHMFLSRGGKKVSTHLINEPLVNNFEHSVKSVFVRKYQCYNQVVRVALATPCDFIILGG